MDGEVKLIFLHSTGMFEMNARQVPRTGEYVVLKTFAGKVESVTWQYSRFDGWDVVRIVLDA